MVRVVSRILGVVALAGLAASGASGQIDAQSGRPIIASRDVGLDQKLNAQVPLDLAFKDETGKDVRLADYIKSKPTILNLIFYRCPGVCTAQLDGMVKVFNSLQFSAGNEFNVVTVSINPNESPSLAADKKETYLALYTRPSAPAGWHFLTGRQENIESLARAIGYRYVYDLKKDQFAHPAGLILLTPEGRISKYFFNAVYNPRDLRLGIIEAADNKVGTPVDQVLLRCLHFDNLTGKYTLAIVSLLKVGATLAMLVLGGCIFAMFRWERQRAREWARQGAAGLPPSPPTPAH